MLLEFRTISQVDWSEIKSIYESGISKGFATFQTSAPSWEERDQSHHPFRRIAVLKNNLIIGYTAISPVSKREVYKGVAEVSLYITDTARGKGVRFLLLTQIISESESNRFWTLQSCIFPQNLSSIKMQGLEL